MRSEMLSDNLDNSEVFFLESSLFLNRKKDLYNNIAEYFKHILCMYKYSNTLFIYKNI